MGWECVRLSFVAKQPPVAMQRPKNRTFTIFNTCPTVLNVEKRDFGIKHRDIQKILLEPIFDLGFIFQMVVLQKQGVYLPSFNVCIQCL